MGDWRELSITVGRAWLPIARCANGLLNGCTHAWKTP